MSLESVREANIRRNEEFLSKLGLEALDQRSHARSKATKRGAPSAAEKRKRTAVVPMRRSGRITTERLKSEIAQAKEEGDDAAVEAKTKMLEEMLQAKQESGGGSYEVVQTPQVIRRSEELIPLIEDSADESQRLIASSLQSKTEVTPSSQSYSQKAYLDTISKLSLAEEDVAKLTLSRITSVVFLRTKKLIVAAGDKGGVLGLWDVNSHEKSAITRYTPHVEGIPKLHAPLSSTHLLYSVRTVHFVYVGFMHTRYLMMARSAVSIWKRRRSFWHTFRTPSSEMSHFSMPRSLMTHSLRTLPGVMVS